MQRERGVVKQINGDTGFIKRHGDAGRIFFSIRDVEGKQRLKVCSKLLINCAHQYLGRG